MKVSEAMARRISVRAFKPDPVPAAVVREILEAAARAPSGGNLQPWKVYALAGAPLADLSARVAAGPKDEDPEVIGYPPNLWDPYRTRRYDNGEALYASIGIPREDRAARFRQIARNGEFFGAPVGLFFAIERRMGASQWAHVGMYMQNVMLLALEHGLDTCPQEFWGLFPRTVREALNLPDDQVVISGMALGKRDESHPINNWRAARAPFDHWAEMRGFD